MDFTSKESKVRGIVLRSFEEVGKTTMRIEVKQLIRSNRYSEVAYVGCVLCWEAVVEDVFFVIMTGMVHYVPEGFELVIKS